MGLARAGARVLVLSVLTYEAAAALILAAGLLYLRRAGWRRARWRWLADAAVVVPLLAWSLHENSRVRPTASVSGVLDTLTPTLHGVAVLIAEALVPLGLSESRELALAILLVAVLATLVIRSRLASWGKTPPASIALAGAGLAVIALGYAMYLGSGLLPRNPGIDNRVNLAAGPGYALVALAVAMLVGELTRRRWPGGGRAVAPVRSGS